MKIYVEEQKFTQAWIVALILISTLIPVYIMTQEFLKDDGSMELLEYSLMMLLLLGLPIFFFNLKLKTRIDKGGITFRFTPFHFKPKHITWSVISKAYTRTYNPLTEYGGWGIKGGAFWNKSKGIAYNISGNKGLQLELKNGKKILIGTKKPTEIDRVLKTYLQNE